MGYIGIYTLPKSGQVNFLWSNNDVSTYYVLWNAMSIKILYLPKQISGYAPDYILF